MAHLLHEVTHELLHVDGKIGRTVKTLFLQPGTLTAEYWAGRRVAWIGPFRVFLIAAAALLFVPGIGPMNLQTTLTRNAGGGYDVRIGTPLPAVGPEVQGAEREAYVGRLRTTYAAIRYAAVPLFAGATLLLYRRRQAYYANHVVLAVHFYVFWYAVSLVTGRLPYRFGVPVAVALGALYLFVALRRLFGEAWTRTAPKTLALSVVMVVLEMALAFAAGTWVATRIA
jgi:hypothetical protein